MTSPPSQQILISDTPTPSSTLLSLLNSHLPYSLPVLRRIQFALNFAGGSSPHTHILHTYPDSDSDHHQQQHFAAAYVDLSRAPETQVWIYSTLEDSSCTALASLSDSVSIDLPGRELKLCDELVSSLLRRVRKISLGNSSSSGGGGGREDEEEVEEEEEKEETWALFGSVNEAVRQRILRLSIDGGGVRMKKTPNVPDDLEWEFCGKWLFRVEDLNDGGGGICNSMSWDGVKKEDVGLVQSRTGILRTEETLLNIPSVVVRLGDDDGTPVAWGFMGYDGTLMTLHVEEPYRRLGLAKAVACKVMRDHLSKYGDDGWGAADVFVENDKSQALCKSIGGVMRWKLSWALIDLSSVGEPL
ncbi:hypothetical protein QBC44DRAFT_343532 [Cladorrhinum sp. PSN332]|nr:hypothetical protein QBC44DRAFT_343532 [Cladorrhinum sp. PSN332]